MAASIDFLWSRESCLLILFFICFRFISVALYRLYFSPLAKFPGPKLAALTYGVKMYHDVLRRGQYTFEILKMHEKYDAVPMNRSSALGLPFDTASSKGQSCESHSMSYISMISISLTNSIRALTSRPRSTLLLRKLMQSRPSQPLVSAAGY